MRCFIARPRVGFLVLVVTIFFWAPAAAEEDFRSAIRAAILAKERAQDSGLPSDWSEALRRLRRANEIRETREVCYEIAVAATNLGHDDLSVEAYQRSLALGLSGHASAKARAHVAEREANLAALTVGGPPKCRVHVNDLERATLPQSQPILIRSGSSTLELRCDGERVRTKQIEINAGEHLQLDLGDDDSAHAVESKQIPATSQVSEPPASVQSKGNAPLVPRIRSDQPQISTARGTRWRALSYGLLGTGVALGAASAVLIPLSNSKLTSSRQALEGFCDVNNDGIDGCTHSKPGVQAEAQSAADAIASWKAARTAGWVGLAAGFAAATTGAALLLVAPSLGKPENPALSVSLTPQRLDLSWRGSF